MDAKFDRRSGGAVYLGLVSLEYVVIGLLGMFLGYAPIPLLLSMFFAVGPYMMLEYIKNCVSGLNCGIAAMGIDFTAMRPTSPSFPVLSAALVCGGIAGIVALYERGPKGRRILFLLCLLGTLAAVANGVNVFAAVYQGFVPFNVFIGLLLVVPCLWSVSYWIGLSHLSSPD